MEPKSSASEEFKDRKTGLLIFGILQIMLGAVCGLMSALIVFSLIMMSTVTPEMGGPNTASMIPGFFLYLMLAVWFIWMGIGSIGARRWARALILVSSWITLITGIGSMIILPFLLPPLIEMLNESGEMPSGFGTFFVIFIVGIIAVMYVMIPGAMALFYGSRHVKATCERYDPKIRWTDRCPLPVLAVSFLAVTAAAFTLVNGAYNWVVPVFGVFLNGVPGAMATLVCVSVLLYIALGAYRLRIAAWWTAAAGILLWCISLVTTVSRRGMMAYYEHMNMPAQQLEQIKPIASHMTPWMNTLMILWMVVIVGYLIMIRKYFTGSEILTQRFQVPEAE